MIIRSTSTVEFRQWLYNLGAKKKRNLNGFQVLFLAFVRNDAADHTVAHEQVHIRQWWRTLGLQPYLRLFWPGIRYRHELEAYIVSVMNGRDMESAARALSIHCKGDYKKAMNDLLRGVSDAYAI